MAQWTVRGDHNFGGTVDSVTEPLIILLELKAYHSEAYLECLYNLEAQY